MFELQGSQNEQMGDHDVHYSSELGVIIWFVTI